MTRADGTGVRALRRGGAAAEAFGLAWSPDGSRLAFVRASASIWVMNADGSELTRLAHETPDVRWLGSPTWSPDGRRIAFTAHNGREDSASDRDIWVMNADGTNQLRLLRTPDEFESEVAWSPTGARLAVVTLYGYTPDITVMNPDGSDRRSLTGQRLGSFAGFEPDWSPNGERIVFTGWRGNAGFAPNNFFPIAEHEVYVVGANGSSRVRLTSNGVSDQMPTWSPDGRRIAFVRAARPLHRSSEIWLMNADGTHTRRLTKNRAVDVSPAWRPVARP